ncbi:TrmH family RNA methyltransferase [Pseudodesulfovibrio tunisiensis]|uniref:TrmH family RNA methyltransferase n=1 Tax=Pseudodesulfovibrio tunisiensis TaxID=463192 RepID=UPI001FB379FD|nr:RNA methyltransferase [Pseudodesulfovibrio tunisiensis]
MLRDISEHRRQRILNVLKRRQKDLTLVMDNIWDPHNVSAVLRSCDAFGVARVNLYYTTAQWPNLGRKTSASAKKWVDRVRHDDGPAMIRELCEQGCQVLKTGFSETARPVMDFDFTRPTAVILSNEHSGTAPELSELVPDEVYIPMQGMVQSLNVSVAAALILYEAFRQRHAAGMFDYPDFSEEELEEKFREWSWR